MAAAPCSSDIPPTLRRGWPTWHESSSTIFVCLVRRSPRPRSRSRFCSSRTRSTKGCSWKRRSRHREQWRSSIVTTPSRDNADDPAPGTRKATPVCRPRRSLLLAHRPRTCWHIFFQAPNVVHVALVNAFVEAKGKTHYCPPRLRTLITSRAQLNRTRKTNRYFRVSFLDKKTNGLQHTAFLSEHLPVEIPNLLLAHLDTLQRSM